MSIIPWKTSIGVPVRHRSGPGSSMFSLQDEINQLFDDFFGGDTHMPALFARAGGAPAFSAPSVDLLETETGYKLRAELPGIEAEQLDLTIGDGYVTIKGEKKEEHKEEGENFLRRESSYGSFQRSVALPEIADTDKAEASFKNGVLTIAMPKKASAVKKEKKLKVKSAA